MFYRVPTIKDYMMDTCLTEQDNDKALLRYFKVKYSDKL